MSQPYIKLIVTRPDGSRSTARIAGRDNVTAPMIDAAGDLIATMTTGERSLPSGLYDAMAIAFDVPRAEAKRRLHRALYGGKRKPLKGKS